MGTSLDVERYKIESNAVLGTSGEEMNWLELIGVDCHDSLTLWFEGDDEIDRLIAGLEALKYAMDKRSGL